MTRTRQTEDRYKRVANRLMAASSRELGCETSEITATTMADWMIRHKAGWSSSTWRQYRAAVSFAFGSQISAPLQLGDLPASAHRGLRTSGQKEKRLPPADLKKLLDHLRERINARNNHHEDDLSPKSLAALLLLCGTIAGLRPGEWPSVILCPPPTQSDLLLQVANAKNTNGRSHGEFRQIEISGLSMSLRKLILLLVSAAGKAKADGSWDRRVASAGKALYRTTRELWPHRKKHYTLYSPRHQAAANWKMILDKEQIAALMGHASRETATTHYGRRSAGRSQVLPGLATVIGIPSEANVLAVRARSAAMMPMEAAFDEPGFNGPS
ncbi:site-specific integrase [Paramagnetospirillum magnetotacticum]|uniref:hypothetical protein n=1 Tax=Paramagnetospirillum magnetotacticum TaxID=188 RepID=UPI000597CF2B|nr:hypothetical protein [Paramagnetospirillum magnetotacticum]